MRLTQEENEQTRDKAFIEKILTKEERRNNEIRNKRIRRAFLENTTYIIQALSVITASYAVFYYLKDYSGFWIVFVAVLGLFILVLNEVGKRFALYKTAGGQTGWIALAIITLVFSMVVSYHGGSKFVIEENTGPEVVHNAQIDSIGQLIAAQNLTIAELKTSKWKGALTRAARDGIREANQAIAGLMKEQRRLQKRDETMNEAIASKHDKKFTKFGYFFGGFAVVLDAVLIGFIVWIKRDEKDIIEHHKRDSNQKSRTAPAPHLKAVNGGVTDREYSLLLSKVNELEKSLSRARAHTPAPTPTHARTRARTSAPAPTRTRTRAHAREGEYKCKECGGVHTGPAGNGYSKKFCSEKCSKKFASNKAK